MCLQREGMCLLHIIKFHILYYQEQHENGSEMERRKEQKEKNSLSDDDRK